MPLNNKTRQLFVLKKYPSFFLNPNSRDAHGRPAAAPLLCPTCLAADQDEDHAALREGGLEHMGMLGRVFNLDHTAMVGRSLPLLFPTGARPTASCWLYVASLGRAEVHGERIAG
jgi:hypothetical protein